MIENVNIMLDSGAYAPERAYLCDAGADLRTPETIAINPHSSVVVDTGVHVEIPDGYVGFIKSKSGLNVKRNINTDGVIDAGYTGSIRVKMYNHGDEPEIFSAGDKITQLVIMPVALPSFNVVEEFEDTERGSDGFGSTGV